MHFLKDFPSSVQSYMAAYEWSHKKLALQHSGKFINLVEYRHPHQKRWSSKVMGAGSLSHVEVKRPPLFFFITQMQITHINQVHDRLQKILASVSVELTSSKGRWSLCHAGMHICLCVDWNLAAVLMQCEEILDQKAVEKVSFPCWNDFLKFSSWGKCQLQLQTPAIAIKNTTARDLVIYSNTT